MHNDFLLKPEKIEIKKVCYQIITVSQKAGGVKKLVPNLGSKHKHGLHYQSMQLYIQLGIRLAKTHRVLKFK